MPMAVGLSGWIIRAVLMLVMSVVNVFVLMLLRNMRMLMGMTLG